jgi:hypothetical protein
MARYLTEYFLHGAISRGREVGQFLGGFSHDGQPAIRYLSMRADESGVVLSLFEKYDPQDEEWCDVMSFGELDEVEQGEAAAEHHCKGIADALALAGKSYGAPPDRWVNEGMLDDEYRDYLTGSTE